MTSKPTMLLVALTVGLVAAMAPARAATIADWRFEGSAGAAPPSIVDETGAHSGSPTGSPTYQSDVPLGAVPQTGAPDTTSLHFTSADFVTIAASGAFDFATRPFTVEMWLKTTYDGNYEGLVGDGDYGAMTGWSIGLMDTGQLLVLGDTSVAGVGAIVVSTASLNDGSWHHVAFVRSGSGANEAAIYIDGALDKTGTFGPITDNGEIVRLGRWGATWNADYAFAGSLDEVRISSAALAPSQLLDAPAPVPEPASLGLLGLTALLGLRRARRGRAP